MAIEEIPEIALEKEAALRAQLAAYGALAVAYSGGVDSAYLAAVAHETLGGAALIVLADSPSIPRAEVRDAEALARERGWNFRVIHTDEFANEDYLKNDGRRCYHCKSELFRQMDAIARAEGVRVLAYGEIADDLLDATRVGAQAAREYRVVAPLSAAGLAKEEIRALSRRMGLSTAEKASFACLSSRFPKGTRVEIAALRQVEQAEDALRAAGFRQYRARHHGDLVRIEIDPAEFPRLLEPAQRAALLEALRPAGYRHVAFDLAGYRTGSTAG